MDSVLVDPSSPDQLHSNFSQAANGAAQAIKHFTQLVEDSRTREVMAEARKSRTRNGEGIAGWKVTEHDDWLDIKQEDGNDGVDNEDEGTAEAGDGPSVKDVNLALDRFRSAHVGVEASLNEDSRTVTVGCLHAFVQVMLKHASSIYLLQPESISRFSSVPRPKATPITTLAAKINQIFTEQSSRQSEPGLDQTNLIISSYVSIRG